MRLVYVAAGHACAALGIVGAFVPILPTTPLLLLAVYFYSRSSHRLRDWLVHHPRFGGPIRDWHERGVVRPAAKLSAIAALSLSIGATVAWGHLPRLVDLGLMLLAFSVALFLLTRPSR